MEPRELLPQGADAVNGCGRPHSGCPDRLADRGPARSENHRMRGTSLHGNREILDLPRGEDPRGRIGKSEDERR